MQESNLASMLQDLQSTPAEFKCIHRLFEERVAIAPDAIALVFDRQQITYRELNIRANRLAHQLQNMGVKSETLVGFYTERSLESIVGLLAILKAGGAYVPIDPSYPVERQNFIIADTQLEIILVQDELIDLSPFNTNRLKVISLSSENEDFSSTSDENIDNDNSADNLAYIMYTSGSTGQPKGVCIAHRGVVRLVNDPNYVKLTPEDVFLQLAPLAFDASTFEVWGCLLNGGKLVIAPPQALSLEELGRVIRSCHVTILWLTAGLFHLMVDRQVDALKSLEKLLAGGDILSVPHVQKFLDAVPNCQLINGYGPTENTTFTCCYSIAKPLDLAASIPIGKPISYTQVYILDEKLHPVEDGVAGELYIGGDGLAREYLNRPELTAEKFINLLFDGQTKIRSYQTGDLARYLPDGNIEFLGRIDNQVKISGFRIELGEIERVLSQHPHVRETVVLARQDLTAEKQLVAYIVRDEHHRLTSENLREFTRHRLPDYMVPAAFVCLDVLPLTPNGKVDRQKLPAPSRKRPQLEQAYIAPQNDLQRQISEIWMSLLGLDRVGIADNFFDLGGTSILSLQVAEEIHQQLGIEIPVVKLFQYSTIAGLSEYLQPTSKSQQFDRQIQNRAQQQRAAQARRRK